MAGASGMRPLKGRIAPAAAPSGGVGTAPGSPVGPLVRASQHTAAPRARSPVGVSRQNPRLGNGTRPFEGEGNAARRALRTGSGLRLVVPWGRPCGLPANPLLGATESRSGFQAKPSGRKWDAALTPQRSAPIGGRVALPVGAAGNRTQPERRPSSRRRPRGSVTGADRGRIGGRRPLLRPYRSGIRQVGPVGVPRARWTASRSTAAAVGVASPSVQAKRWVP